MSEKRLVWRELEDGVFVMLDLESGLYYSLNWTAAVVWDELQRGGTVESAATRLALLTGQTDEPRLRNDVEELVKRLDQLTLLGDAETSEACSPEGTEGEEPLMSRESRGEYEKPCVQEHEALHEVTAGSYSGSSSYYYGGYTYYYYYYYYY